MIEKLHFFRLTNLVRPPFFLPVSLELGKQFFGIISFGHSHSDITFSDGTSIALVLLGCHQLSDTSFVVLQILDIVAP